MLRKKSPPIIHNSQSTIHNLNYHEKKSHQQFTVLNPIMHNLQSNLNAQEKKAHQQFTARGLALFFSSKVFTSSKSFTAFSFRICFPLILSQLFLSSSSSNFYFMQATRPCHIHIAHEVGRLITFTFTPGGETYHFHFLTRWGDRGVWVQGPVHL